LGWDVGGMYVRRVILTAKNTTNTVHQPKMSSRREDEEDRAMGKRIEEEGEIIREQK